METPSGAVSANGGSSFKALLQEGGQVEKTSPLAFTPDFSLTHPVGSPGDPTTAFAILSPRLELSADSLSALSKRIAVPGPTGAGSPLQNRLQLLETQFRQTSDDLNLAARQTDSNPLQLLKLQQDIYQIEEQVELLSKVVEQTTSGIKSVLQTQI